MDEVKSFEKCQFSNGNYIITKKQPYKHLFFFTEEEKSLAFNFAYDMTFGKKGEHRAHRTGGSLYRTPFEIYTNTFLGKLAEIGFKRFFDTTYHNFEPLSDVDFDCWKLGKWDFSDFTWRNKNIAIKSSKSFANLLLLECKDWDSEGHYIPNKNCEYFMIVFVRVGGDALNIPARLLREPQKDMLKLITVSRTLSCDVPGYIKNDDLRFIIENKHIIEKGKTLNTKTKIDADNYYVQAGDLRAWPKV